MRAPTGDRAADGTVSQRETGRGVHEASRATRRPDLRRERFDERDGGGTASATAGERPSRTAAIVIRYQQGGRGSGIASARSGVPRCGANPRMNRVSPLPALRWRRPRRKSPPPPAMRASTRATDLRDPLAPPAHPTPLPATVASRISGSLPAAPALDGRGVERRAVTTRRSRAKPVTASCRWSAPIPPPNDAGVPQPREPRGSR